MVRIIARLIILQFFLLIGFVFTWSHFAPTLTTITASENSAPTVTPTVVKQPATAIAATRPIPTQTETVQITSQPAPQPASNRCIIVIDGNQYDVSEFRTIHSGGNIFECGTDMSAIFWGQHNQGYLDTMAKYRI